MTWAALLDDYLKEFKHHCVPFPNLISMLEELQNDNLLLGMITNGKGQFQLDNIKALGIEEYFDPILVSEWEGIKKPQSQIFGRALKQLGILPEEALFIGDHPINDVQGARDVGMISVWKKDGQWTKVAADYIIEDLSELPNLIQVINR